MDHGATSDIAQWYERLLESDDPESVFALEFGTLYDGGYQQISALSSELNHRREIGYYLAHAVQSKGLTAVLEAVEAYLNYPSVNELEFVRSLWCEE